MENTKNKWKKIFTVEENYDAHVIAEWCREIEAPVKREYTRSGEAIYVLNIDYIRVLKFITTNLLRRKPNRNISWVDYYGIERSYDVFPITALDIEEGELANTVTNSNPILTESKIDTVDKKYISIDCNLSKLPLENKWEILRYEGLSSLIATAKQVYFDNTIKSYEVDIDGYIDVDKQKVKVKNTNL